MTKRSITICSVVAVVIIAVVSARLVLSRTQDRPGEAISIQPSDHIKPGEPMIGIYLTNPPVSGWHYDEKTTWGIHNEEIKDQIVLSTIEDGGVWISYTPDAPTEVIDELKKIVEKYKGDRVILAPRMASDSLMALAAWGYLDKFSYLDEARIVRFIKAYK